MILSTEAQADRSCREHLVTGASVSHLMIGEMKRLLPLGEQIGPKHAARVAAPQIAPPLALARNGRQFKQPLSRPGGLLELERACKEGVEL